MNTNKNIYAAVAALVFMITGCDQATLGGLSTTTTSETPTSTTTVGDVKRIVSTGPSLSFNALTGGVNDLAVNPVTKLPAMTYYDKSANIAGTVAVGALKYAYMDEYGAWNIEVVDFNTGGVACGTTLSNCIGAPNAAAGNTTSIIRMAFKTTGEPVIAYVYGGSAASAGGFKQIRYAERSSTTGKWTVSVAFSASTAALATNVAIATIDPMKSVTLNLDTADRPHITFAFYAQTALANSFVKYLFRSTAGTWTSSNIISNVSAGAIAATGQGDNQSGAVFCPLNNQLLAVHHIVDAAAGAGKPVFIRCTTVGADGGCTAWSTLNLANGCTGATSCFSSGVTTASNSGIRTDIAIDPATNRPIVGIYSVAAPVTTLLTVTAPLACDQAQTSTAGAWGAPVNVGTALQGANGFRLSTSTTALNTNYISYLTSTTSVTSNKSTGPDGAWFATGTTIETNTVAAEGVGAAYEATNDVLFTSYAVLPGAAAGAIGNDIKVSYGASADITLAGAAGTFITEVVDNTMSVFPTTAVPSISSAKASNGTVGYAYFYQDGTVGDSKLYYGIRGGTTSAPVFGQTFVTSHQEGAASPAFVGSYPSLTYDANNNPIIAYWNGAGTELNLQIARSFNGGASFAISVVDDTSASIGQYPSITRTGNTLGIAYYDVTNTGLKFARYTPATGWKKFAVDGMTGASCGVAGDDAGSFAKLQFNAAGKPVIVYQSNGALKVAVAAEAASGTSFTWSCVNIDNSANVRGAGIDFALDSTNIPHIVHFDATAGIVRYVNCASDVSTCVSTGTAAFTGSVLATSGITTTISTIPQIELSSSGTRYATYYSSVDQGLALATRTSSASSWTIETIDGNTSGTSTSAAGQYSSLILNASEKPIAFYRSFENWLKYFSRED
jgi:hypothetical protein